MRRRITPLLLLAAAFALALSACSSETTPTSTTLWSPPSTGGSPGSTAPTTAPTDPSNPTAELRLYLDGWSLAALGSADLYFVTRDSALGTPLDFAPLSPPEISALLSDQPELVARVVGRLVNTDFSWSCEPSGCTSTAEELSAADISLWLTDLSRVPAYGESYRAQNMTAGLYVATVDVSPDIDLFEVYAVPADTDFDPALVEWSSQVSTIQVGSLAPTPAGEGFVAALGAGLGRIFPLEPAWVSSGSTYHPDFFGGISADDPAYAIDVAANHETLTAAFAAGLGDTSARNLLRTLSPSELTYLTSPTVGCAPGVLCLPGTISEMESEVTTSTVLSVCLSPEVLGHEPEAGHLRAEAVFTTARRDFALPSPIHQNGLWGGVSPTEFNPATDRTVQLLSLPPLASGELSTEVTTLGIYAQTFVGEPPALWTQLTRIAQLGVEEPHPWTPAELLAALDGVSLCDQDPA